MTDLKISITALMFALLALLMTALLWLATLAGPAQAQTVSPLPWVAPILPPPEYDPDIHLYTGELTIEHLGPGVWESSHTSLCPGSTISWIGCTTRYSNRCKIIVVIKLT